MRLKEAPTLTGHPYDDMMIDHVLVRRLRYGCDYDFTEIPDCDS